MNGNFEQNSAYPYTTAPEGTLEIRHGHAMTVHKSQGQTLQNVLLYNADISSCKDKSIVRNLLYTAHTRSSDDTVWFNLKR